MRLALGLAALLLCGCGPGLVFNASQEMSHDEMLRRASLVFVGVIKSHHVDSWPFFWLTMRQHQPDRPDYWKVLRRRVRVELVLRGAESRRGIDVYEIHWTGGTSGNWNSTQDGERALFLVRVENGLYHVVRDWWRSIFPVTAGPRPGLPLDDSYPLWERIALMNYWIAGSAGSSGITSLDFFYSDPGMALSTWRQVKLLRGLVRHPSASIRIPACRTLLQLGGWDQDECWDMLAGADQAQLSSDGSFCCSTESILARRRQAEAEGAAPKWQRFRDQEGRRRLTAMNNPRLRDEFCRLWQREYPSDHDNGCPANQPPPATIVTACGDVPLAGPWPQ
jgi:hypothetical protein